MSLPITVLIQTKNERRAIESCITALTAFDEVIVIDSNSVDGTAEIAARLGVEVINFTWNAEYPKKKQWQLDNVRTANKWVLFLDADEQPSQELVKELRGLNLPDLDNVVAFDIPLTYIFMGRPLRHGHIVKKRALVRRGRVTFPVVDDLESTGMGELEGHYQPLADGQVLALHQRLVHDDPDPIRSWFDRHNRYSDWEANLELSGQAQRVRAFRSPQGRVFARSPLKPLAFFIFSYFLRRGYMDGQAGFSYALALSFYYWQIDLKIREGRRLNKSSSPHPHFGDA